MLRAPLAEGVFCACLCVTKALLGEDWERELLWVGLDWVGLGRSGIFVLEEEEKKKKKKKTSSSHWGA